MLEILDDDAIVAQQSEAHAPQQRVSVTMETQTVVVAQEEGPRELPVYDQGPVEQTVVVRDRRGPQSGRGKRRGWLSIVLWGAAALAAFAVGGVVARSMSNSGETAAEANSAPAAPVVAPPPPVKVAEPAPQEPTPTEPVAGEISEASEESAKPEPNAVNPLELPVEKKKVSAPVPRRSSVPAAQPKPKPAESDIPAGI